MVQPGRRVILVVRVPKAQLLQEPSRRLIRWIVSRKERLHSKNVECALDHRPRSLGSIPLAPESPPQVDPNLANPFFPLVGSKPAAPDMLTRGEQKNRPILDAVRLHRGDLPRKPLLHLLPGEGSSNQPGHLGITPQSHCQVHVRVRPQAKSKAFALEQIRAASRCGARTRLSRHTFPRRVSHSEQRAYRNGVQCTAADSPPSRKNGQRCPSRIASDATSSPGR